MFYYVGKVYYWASGSELTKYGKVILSENFMTHYFQLDSGKKSEDSTITYVEDLSKATLGQSIFVAGIGHRSWNILVWLKKKLILTSLGSTAPIVLSTILQDLF